MILPIPWCEEFSFQIDDIFTRLRIVEKEKTRGKSTTKEVSNMTGIFTPHKCCKQPLIVLIEGEPGMGKTLTLTPIAKNWYLIGQSNSVANGMSLFQELMCSCSSDVVESNLLSGTLLKTKFCQLKLSRRKKRCFSNS